MLTIDHALYGDAAEAFAEANQVLAATASALFDALGEAAVSAGEGDGARAWCSSYEQAAGTVVAQISELIDAFGNTAMLLDASGHNHARAEAAAAPYGLPPEAPTPRDLLSVSLSGIPEMYGGNVGEPWGWSLIVSHLNGFAWPGADVARIRALATAWHQAAGGLRGSTTFAARANGYLAPNDSPELPEADLACRRLNDVCLALARDCDTLGDACSGYADAVERARSQVKHAFKELLGAAGVGAGISIGAALLSGGLSTILEGALGDFLGGTIAGSYLSQIIASLGALSDALATLNPALAISDAQSGQSAWLNSVANAVPVMAAVDADTRLLKRELGVVARGGASGGAGRTDEEIIEEGWANRRTLAKHLEKHAADVDAKSEADYVRAAQELLIRARQDGLPMKIASDGTIRVFDPTTGLFASYRSDGRARTIFRPDPPASAYWSKQPGVLQ